MIKRTVEISQEAFHLAVKHDQLTLERFEPTREVAASIPCEDLGVLVVDQHYATYSHSALVRLVESGAVVVLCGKSHLPVGLVLPLAEHNEVVWRLHEQIAMSEPLKKRLWQEIVVAKIHAQAALLETPHRERVAALASRVRSGDPDNVEAQAAKVFWSLWLGDSTTFQRDKDGGDPANAFLNYGYAIVRAAVARALVAAGLHPTLGIHHAHRGNPFCLADDLMEPLRPFVDRVVRDLVLQGQTELLPTVKRTILALLAATARFDDHAGPFLVQLPHYVASFVRCMRGEDRRLTIPELTTR